MDKEYLNKIENIKNKINTEKEYDFLMEVRNGKYLSEDDSIRIEFMNLVNILEKELQDKANTTRLPDKPDYKKINELLIRINKEVISNGYV